jgi:hypothetical protein
MATRASVESGALYHLSAGAQLVSTWRVRISAAPPLKQAESRGQPMKSQAKDVATLKRLEGRLQLPSVRTSRHQLDLLLADEFVEFGSSGKIFNKRQVIAAMLADPASRLPRYATLQSVKMTRLADDVALLTYRSSKSHPGAPRPVHAHRSSIWKRIDGRWQLVFHQGTPLGVPRN